MRSVSEEDFCKSAEGLARANYPGFCAAADKRGIHPIEYLRFVFETAAQDIEYPTMEYNGVRYDCVTDRVTVDGVLVRLRHKEKEILLMMLHRAVGEGGYVLHGDFYQEIWGCPARDTLKATMSSLRGKVGRERIESKDRGRRDQGGYRLTPPS